MAYKLRLSGRDRFSLLLQLSNTKIGDLYLYQLELAQALKAKLGPLPITTPAGKQRTFKTIAFTGMELEFLLRVIEQSGLVKGHYLHKLAKRIAKLELADI